MRLFAPKLTKKLLRSKNCFYSIFLVGVAEVDTKCKVRLAMRLSSVYTLALTDIK